MALEVRVAEAGEVRDLQQAVLRPSGPLPGDQPPPAGSVHVAALIDGEVVGAATVMPAPWPGPDVIREPAWRLRGMVVAEGARGAGVGRAVLDQAVHLAASNGAAAVWAEARTSALGFYRRAGWAVVGDEWDKPGVGPHRYIHMPVTDPSHP